MSVDAVTSHMGELRRLEAAAADDPGYEASHDHVTSSAYDAYKEGRTELRRLVGLLDPPAEWVDLFEWTKENDHTLGEVSMPGVHKVPCGWVAGAHSVRTILLEAMLAAARAAPSAPIWDEEAIAALIADPEWGAQPSFPGAYPADARWTDLIAHLVAVTGRNAILDRLHGEPLERARDRLDPGRRIFEVIDLEIVRANQGEVEVRIRFENRAGNGNAVLLNLVEAETGRPLTIDCAVTEWSDIGTRARSQIEGIEVEVSDRALTIRIPDSYWSEHVPPGEAFMVSAWTYEHGTFRTGPAATFGG